jgi:two-component system, chemotaxis family, sensor kinase CheA
MDLSAFYAQFREETTDNVRVVADGLLALERAPGDRGTIDAVFRAAHTLKGSARLLGFGAVANLAHAMESLLGAIRAQTLTLTPAHNDLLLQANDALLALALAASDQRTVDLDTTSLIGSLESAAAGGAIESTAAVPDPAPPEPAIADRAPPAPIVEAAQSDPVAAAAVTSTPIQTALSPVVAQAPSAPAVPASQPAASRPARATVRVRVDRLDRLLAVVGELTVGQQADGDHVNSLHALTTLVAQQQRALQALERDLRHGRLTPAQRANLAQRVADMHARGGEIREIARTQHEAYIKRSATTGVLVEELEAEVFAARLVPVATAFATLPRAVRELARTLDKQVELELLGEETEADRKVLDALSEPLLHMVRNALDHGIETPAERSAAGKPPVGKLTIAAMAEHGQIRIAVSDDGCGMDPDKLRAIAVRKGLLDQAAANQLNDTDVLDLIFMPGFSSSQMITDVSGRGVGMDVVRSRMVELGGQVIVDSLVGHGTTITLVLPISLMTSQVLLVEAGKHTWAIPSRSCQAVLRLSRENVHRVEGQPLLQLDGKSVPLVTLASLLDVPAADAALGARGHALLLGVSRPVAVVIDRLVDEREVVVKPLGPLFGDHATAAGVAPMPDGSLCVVLSVQGLLSQLRRARSVPLAPTRPSRARRLLITDDSFTTRELLRSILQSAGYDVTTAVDGQDALDKLRADTGFDLVVSDVEMPRLDGFGLTASIRADPDLTHLPVVIVTSLHSDEHKRRGMAAGAQAYIVKSLFDQSNLLAAVRDLLGAAQAA